MEKRSFVKGAAILGIAGILVKIIGAVYRIPLGNLLGVDGMEYYAVVYPYYSALLMISSAGLPTAISKLVAERCSLGDFAGAKNIFRVARRLLLIIGIVTTLLMYFCAPFLAKGAMLEGAELGYQALAPALFFVSIMCAYRGYLQGLQRMTGTALSQVVEQVGKLAIGLLLAAQWLDKGPQYAAMGALLGVSASELLALVVVMVFHFKRGGITEKDDGPQLPRDGSFVPARKGSVMGNLLAVAIPVTIGAMIMPITGILDVSMIKSTLMDIGFSGESAGAAFTILRSYVTPIANMPSILTTALAMSLVPAISQAVARRDKKKTHAVAYTGTKLAIILSLPCAVGLYVLGEPVIGMLYSVLEGEELALAGDLMRTAAVGVFFLGLVQTMTGIIQGLGKQNVPVINLILGGILKVITMLVLMRIPSVNIQGAAVSTVVCYGVAAVLDMVFMVRYVGLKIRWWDMLGKPLAASLVMGVVVWLIREVMGDGSLATLVAVLVGVMVYAVLAVVLRMLGKEELRFMPGGRRLAKLFDRKGGENNA